MILRAEPEKPQRKDAFVSQIVPAEGESNINQLRASNLDFFSVMLSGVFIVTIASNILISTKMCHLQSL
jgi:hypothetical protein